MGIGSERHDIHSYETHDAQWIGFRQPVMRAFRERLGEKVSDTRGSNPGEVWEENEFWIELSWRIDPDGALAIRKFFESRERPGEKLSVDEYYRYIFENSVPGLPERAAARRLWRLSTTCAAMGPSKYRRARGALHEAPVPAAELEDHRVDPRGRVFTRAAKPTSVNIVPQPTPPGDAEGRRPVGVEIDSRIVRGFPTPSGKLEFYSSTLAKWGWPEHALPGYIKSQIHPENLDDGEIPLIPTFRLPGSNPHPQRELEMARRDGAHTNPLWIHPRDAERLGVRTGELRARRDPRRDISWSRPG